MKRILNKIITCLLIGIIAFGLYPVALADGVGTYELSNGFIKLVVSAKNGGFVVLSENGDRVNKDDNNKNLLFHNDVNDTSFTSFDVTYPDNSKKQYIFGSNYSFLGLGGNDLAITKDSTGISAVWTVDNLTFTQRMELANSGAAEHGMVYITYSVDSKNAGRVNVKARVLLDSSLGNQDYAYYQVADSNNSFRMISSETVITTKDYIPSNFLAYDDKDNPSITAYTVNTPESKPYQVSFGHWNNLASTIFDFTPDANLTFTNAYNKTYRTADSAYALYYDMGDIDMGNSGKKISSYYGVYSNEKTMSSDGVTINLTSPTSLELAGDKKHYLSTYSGLEDGTFSITALIKNYVQESAKDYSKVAVAVYTSNGITPLDSIGKDLGYSVSYSNPYRITYSDFNINNTQATNFFFRADVNDSASYRKVEIKVFNMPDSANGKFLQDNQLGSAAVYVLCPGGDGALPKIVFTKAAPDVMYCEGVRHLNLTGGNFSMLEDTSRYQLYLKNSTTQYLIPSSQIFFPEENVIDILLTEKMLPGDYSLVFEWSSPPEGIDAHLTAPALKVIISDDNAYRNDYYGIVAVVREKGTPIRYSIKTYATEAKFEADKTNNADIILTFRGDFTPSSKDSSGNITKISAFSQKSTDNNGDSKINNRVTLNNCIDFENGNINIYYDYSGPKKAICVDFEGDLYTSNARTKIWKGNAALTKISDGEEFGLVPYNSRGHRLENFNKNQITLIWPCALGVAQTLAGMVINLTYGALGVVYDSEISKVDEINNTVALKGYSLSFSANLDLSFLVPSASKSEGAKEWEEMEKAFNVEDMNGIKLRDQWNGLDFTSNYMKDTGEEDERDTDGQASVMVNDILFGCGEGFMGFNTVVNVQLPPYVESMPLIKGKLTINTIGGWELGLEGSCAFTTITFEAEIGLKSYKGVPIPDKLYLYVSGFEPGINIDTYGVLWITGGGGGFEDLYDTIFTRDTIPPLKLLISCSFDLLKVLSARADIGLGLRGVSFKASEVKIKATEIKALDTAQVKLDWYPDIYLLASIKVSLLNAISGSGYIVFVNNDKYKNFVEAFARVSVQVPEEIPVFGGTEVGNVDVGLNNSGIWGAFKLIDISVGVKYYWAKKSLDFGSGDIGEPTFPELLGFDDKPVYTDEKTGETLYMHIGTNICSAVGAETVADLNNVMSLLGSGDPFVKSNINKTTHIINAGTYSGESKLLYISFSADSKNTAKNLVSGISINDGTKPFNLTLYDGTNINTANANMVYNDSTKKGSLAFSITNSVDFNKDWNISTPTESDISLFNVDNVSAINSVSGNITGDAVNINWSGSILNKLDSIGFYLTEDDGKSGTLNASDCYLGTLTDSGDITGGTKSFSLPPNLRTGNYYVRAVYSNNIVNSSITSSDKISYVNLSQPSDPNKVAIKNGGDLRIDVSVDKTITNDYDGYLLNVYKNNKSSSEYEISDVSNMTYMLQKDASGTLFMPPVSIGGSYTGMDNNKQPVKYGLEADNLYKVGVTAFKNVYATDGKTVISIIKSSEVLSDALNLKAPTPTIITEECLTASKKLVRNQWGVDNDGVLKKLDVEYETYKTNSVDFKYTADTEVTGKWSLDHDAMTGDFNNTNSISLALADLTEGDHTLILLGKDVDGDGFRFTKTFTVDTQPPRLMLTSPYNGSFFKEDGGLTVTGVTDNDSLISIVADGTIIASMKTVAELGGTINSDGVFSFDCNLEPSMSKHQLLITAKDEMDNSSKFICNVYNKGLADVTGVEIYMNGVNYKDKNLRSSSDANLVVGLTLAAKTKNGNRFTLNDNKLVEWDVKTIEGVASIDGDGALSIGKGSIGYVVGSFKIAENAAMTTSATFGAEAYSDSSSKYQLVVGTTMGGSANGTGLYDSDTDIPISAVTVDGYIFEGWTSENGGSFKDSKAMATTFKMPSNNTVIIAHFKYINSTNSRSNSGNKSTRVYAKAKQKVSIPLPYGMNEFSCIPYYSQNGETRFVPLSEVIDGNLIFIAPVDAEYYFADNRKTFLDIANHWAEKYIYFGGARELVKGVMDEKFDADSSLTRAMFVTILGRLEGIPATSGKAEQFTDVEADTWYTPYVKWSSDNKIVSGYGNGSFGPDDLITREQLSAIMIRYLEYKGLLTEANNDNGQNNQIFTDGADISDWAVSYIKRCYNEGLILGKNGNVIAPKTNTTRAEACTVLYRMINVLLKGTK